MDIERAAHRGSMVLEPDGLPRQGDVSIGPKPEVVEAGDKLSGRPVVRVPQARMPFKGRVELDKPVVLRLLLSVEEHLDDAESDVHRREERTVLFLLPVSLVLLVPLCQTPALPANARPALLIGLFHP
jgi:hypothetical protein